MSAGLSSKRGWPGIGGSAVAAVFVLLSAVAADAAPRRGRVTVGARVGTTGPGVQVSGGLTRFVGVRAHASQIGVRYRATQDNLNFDAAFRARPVSLLVDVHPFGNAFRLSAGWVHHGLYLEGTATPRERRQWGPLSLTPEEIGTISARADPKNAGVGYAGLGFGRPLGGRRRWMFFGDAGVMFLERIDLVASADGLAADNPLFEAELERRRRDGERELRRIRYFPVLALGFALRF